MLILTECVRDRGLLRIKWRDELYQYWVSFTLLGRKARDVMEMGKTLREERKEQAIKERLLGQKSERKYENLLRKSENRRR